MSLKITGLAPPVTQGAYYTDLALDLEIVQSHPDKKATYNFVKGPDIRSLKDAECIFNNILNLFGTSPGDIPLNPDMGLNLRRFIGEPVSVSLAEQLGMIVKNTLEKYEPRIYVTNVLVLPVMEPPMYKMVVEINIPSLGTTTMFGGNLDPLNEMSFIYERI